MGNILQIRLPEELNEKFAAACKKRNTTKTAVLQTLISGWIESGAKMETEAEVWERRLSELEQWRAEVTPLLPAAAPQKQITGGSEHPEGTLRVKERKSGRKDYSVRQNEKWVNLAKKEFEAANLKRFIRQQDDPEEVFYIPE